MRKAVQRVLAAAQANPHKTIGFLCGAGIPLVVLAIFWAQTSGGLAGPLVDIRPPAFVVLTD